MHECNHLSCLSVSVRKIGGDLDVKLSRIGGDIFASVYRIGAELSIHANSIGEDLSISAQRLGGLKVSCSILCSVNKDTPYWMWNAGQILYWDNNEYIGL